jgi:hypothetical protein
VRAPQLVRSGRTLSSADRCRDTLRLTANYLAFLQLASIGLWLRLRPRATDTKVSTTPSSNRFASAPTYTEPFTLWSLPTVEGHGPARKHTQLCDPVSSASLHSVRLQRSKENGESHANFDAIEPACGLFVRGASGNRSKSVDPARRRRVSSPAGGCRPSEGACFALNGAATCRGRSGVSCAQCCHSLSEGACFALNGAATRRRRSGVSSANPLTAVHIAVGGQTSAQQRTAKPLSS